MCCARLLCQFPSRKVACEKCGRAGRHRLDRLIEQRGTDGKMPDFLAQVSADCPRQETPSITARHGISGPTAEPCSMNWSGRHSIRCRPSPTSLPNGRNVGAASTTTSRARSTTTRCRASCCARRALARITARTVEVFYRGKRVTKPSRTLPTGTR